MSCCKVGYLAILSWTVLGDRQSQEEVSLTSTDNHLQSALNTTRVVDIQRHLRHTVAYSDFRVDQGPGHRAQTKTSFKQRIDRMFQTARLGQSLQFDSLKESQKPVDGSDRAECYGSPNAQLTMLTLVSGLPDDYSTALLKNRLKLAEYGGYEYCQYSHRLEHEREVVWSKILAVSALLEAGRKTIQWLDADAVMVHLNHFEGIETKWKGDPGKELTFTNDFMEDGFTGANVKSAIDLGVFKTQNSPWAKKFWTSIFNDYPESLSHVFQEQQAVMLARDKHLPEFEKHANIIGWRSMNTIYSRDAERLDKIKKKEAVDASLEPFIVHHAGGGGPGSAKYGTMLKIYLSDDLRGPHQTVDTDEIAGLMEITTTSKDTAHLSELQVKTVSALAYSAPPKKRCDSIEHIEIEHPIKQSFDAQSMLLEKSSFYAQRIAERDREYGCLTSKKCKLPMFLPARVPPTTPQKIPRILWVTWKSREVEPELYQRLVQFWQQNLDYEWIFTDDDTMDAFMLSEDVQPDWRKAYSEIIRHTNSLTSGAIRADFWRYVVLHNHGGVYMDIDIMPMSFAMLKIPSDASIYQPWSKIQPELPNFELCQYALFFNPEHKLLKSLLQSVTEDIHQGQQFDSPYFLTGPAKYAKAWKETIGSHTDCSPITLSTDFAGGFPVDGSPPANCNTKAFGNVIISPTNWDANHNGHCLPDRRHWWME